MNLQRLERLFATVRKNQREIDAAQSRIRKNEQENRFDQALIDKLEREMKQLSKDIQEAKRQ